MTYKVKRPEKDRESQFNADTAVNLSAGSTSTPTPIYKKGGNPHDVGIVKADHGQGTEDNPMI